MQNSNEGGQEKIILTEQDVVNALIEAKTNPFDVAEFIKFIDDSNSERESKIATDPENTYRANMENSIRIFTLLYKVKGCRNAVRPILDALQQSASASSINRDLAQKIQGFFDECALGDKEAITNDVETLTATFDLVEAAFKNGGREAAKPLLGGLYNSFTKLNRFDPNIVINPLKEWNPEGDLTKEQFEILNRRRKILSNAVGIMTSSGQVRHDLNPDVPEALE
ncbi:MAG: hypothetical protein WC757_01975 [Candidatus Paceibacterota bacterium]|jgi:hypothetical protein